MAEAQRPTETPAWRALQAHYEKIKDVHLRQLFADDPKRGERLTAGVEPDVWKIEGLDRREDCVKIVETVRRDGRNNIGCIILGRGSNEQKVIEWLRNAAGVPGFIGFAVGRTSFWEALVDLRDSKIARQNAVEQIAQRYMKWVGTFEEGSRS
jgi:myo-inositol catabolism protein IolC